MTTTFKTAFTLMSAAAACVILSGAQARAEEPAAPAVDMQKIYALMDASRERTLELVVQNTEDAIARKLTKIDNPFDAPAPAQVFAANEYAAF